MKTPSHCSCCKVSPLCLTVGWDALTHWLVCTCPTCGVAYYVTPGTVPDFVYSYERALKGMMTKRVDDMNFPCGEALVVYQSWCDKCLRKENT